MTNHHDSLILSDIVLIEFCRINYMELLEALQKLKEGLTRITCIVTRAAGDHRKVGAEDDSFFDSAEIWFEKYVSLLLYFITIESLERCWGPL